MLLIFAICVMAKTAMQVKAIPPPPLPFHYQNEKLLNQQ